MALNPSIILAGQPIDIVGSFARGNELAAQTNQLQDQNALRQVYKTQGAGLLSGNQSSLNALAAIDPGQAMQLQANQLDMSATRQRMDMLTREEQRQIEAAKASMSAAEAAAAAQQIEDAVKMGLAIQDPAQWDAVMAQQAPELVGQFANKQAFAMKYMTMAEVLKANQGPEWQPATAEEAARYGAAAGQINRETGKFDPAPQSATTNVTVNNPGDDKFSEAFAKEDATTLATVSNAGNAAIRNIGRINQLETLLSQAPTGATGAMMLAAGNFGINTEGLSELQAAQALINSLVPEQRQPGSGPMSDADLALFKESLPRIINQPGGNETILRTMRAIAEYDAEGARIVQEHRAGKIDRATAFDRLQARKNPLDNFTVPSADPVVPPPTGNSDGVNWRIVQ